MKTTLKLAAIIGFTLLAAGPLSQVSNAADTNNKEKQYQDFYTVRGTVKERGSNKILEYANISLKGSNIGTITNSNGSFSLKIPNGQTNRQIEVTHIGYNTVTVNVGKESTQELSIQLDPLPGLLDEITIKAIDAEELVSTAIEKITANYNMNAQLLTGFYRETIRKRKSYINVSEAVVDIYKRPYSENSDIDFVAIHKGRKLISTKPQDTLMVKFLGGPNLILYLDVVKSPDLMFAKSNLYQYKYTIEEIVMIEERPHYVVSFVPRVILPYALHYGKLYIDRHSLAVSRAEVNVDMSDRNKVTDAILKKKPLSMRFRVDKISYLVTYKHRDGKTHLNYIRSETEFRCDWKRRLFSTNYSIVSETVITGGRNESPDRMRYRTAFRDNQSLSERVQNFYDPDFWENYNIIEPEESLENAVSRLLKTREE